MLRLIILTKCLDIRLFQFDPATDEPETCTGFKTTGCKVLQTNSHQHEAIICLVSFMTIPVVTDIQRPMTGSVKHELVKDVKRSDGALIWGMNLGKPRNTLISTANIRD